MTTPLFPDNVKTFGNDVVDNVHTIYAAHINELRAEVSSIEATLGAPGLRNSTWTGTFTTNTPVWPTLVARLANIERGIVATSDVHTQYVKKAGDTVDGLLTLNGGATLPVGKTLQVGGLKVWTDPVGWAELIASAANVRIAAGTTELRVGYNSEIRTNRQTQPADTELALVTKGYVDTKSSETATAATNANNNANNRVAKSGDEMTGPLWTPSVRIGPQWSLERDGNKNTFTLVRFSPNGQQVESFPMTIDYNTGLTAFAHLVYLAGGAMFSDATVPEVGLWSGQDQCRWMLYDDTGRLRRMSDASFISMIHYVTSSSSRRFKTDITDPEPIDVTRLQPRAYRWRATEAQSGLAPGERLGLIAEEVAEVDERLVTKGPDDEVHGLDHSALIAALIAEVQRLRDRVDRLESL